MHGNDELARQFDDSRDHLRTVAYRLLGSASEADDAVQEAWVKLSRSDTSTVENLRGWLTTVVARVSLDMLRARFSRREEPLASLADVPGDSNPEIDVAFADTVGQALLVVLEMLAPAERVAFVLHDMFDWSFEAIALVLDRSPAAARQLASRARRRVRGATATRTDVTQRAELVSAFLAASRGGSVERLVAVLAPDVALRADEVAVRLAAANQRHGAPSLAPELRGASLVANAFKGRARAALPALIDGEPGAVWAVGGLVRAAFVFTIEHGEITDIEIVMDPAHLAELDVKMN